jgi:hypothetical protein
MVFCLGFYGYAYGLRFENYFFIISEDVEFLCWLFNLCNEIRVVWALWGFVYDTAGYIEI